MFGTLSTESISVFGIELGPGSWEFWGLYIIYFPVSLSDQYLRLQRERERTT